MLYYLKSVNSNKAFYLVRQTEFIVGRKDCDIIIENDSSISRTHAKLIIKQGKIGEVVTLTDLGSKYKTFRNELVLQPNSETTLKVNDTIKFGGLSSLFTLHQEIFVTTATKLSSAQREALGKQLRLLKGQYTDNWGPNCTHLTLEQINLTVKVLQALLDDKPIVLPTYWSKYAENVLNKLPPPDINDYNNPPITEALLNQGEWRRNINRKGIFKNKIFLFFTEQEKKPVELLIKQAGGTAISWQNNPVKLEDILESHEEYLLMLSTKPSDDKSYDEIIKHFAKKKYRTIPTQEIAMAIVYGSCEKNCNPSFDRAKVVFQKQPVSGVSMQHPLAENTQTQNVTIKDNKSCLRSIPETLDMDMDMDVPPMKKKKFAIISEHSSKTTEQPMKIQENESNISKLISRNENETQNSLDIAATTSKGSKTSKSTDKNKSLVTKKLENSSLIEKTTSTESHTSKRKADDSDEDANENNPFKRYIIKMPKTETSTEAAKTKDGPSNELPSTAQSLKRKADEPKEIPSKDTFKLRKTENVSNDPFSSLQLNMNNTKCSSDNPFLIEKVDDSSLFRNTKICEKKKNNTSWSYTNYATSADNTTWISKEDPADYLENDVKREIDDEEQRFIDLFKDTFIVEVASELLLKPRSRFADELDCSTAAGGVNFKKFKKVKPLHPQKTMYDQEAFQKPKDKGGPVVNDKLFDSDEESVGPSRRRLKTFDI